MQKRYVVQYLNAEGICRMLNVPTTSIIYEKEGGSQTADLQEAKVVGWSKRSKERWNYPNRYKLIPVDIVIK